MEPDRWICTQCWRFRPRADVEALEAAFTAGGPHRDEQAREGNWRGVTAAWVCEHCGSTATFVPEESTAGAAICNDLVFEAYAARLQEAGYAVLAMSAECDSQDHAGCRGRNRLESGTPLDSCSCSCHHEALPGHPTSG